MTDLEILADTDISFCPSTDLLTLRYARQGLSTAPASTCNRQLTQQTAEQHSSLLHILCDRYSVISTTSNRVAQQQHRNPAPHVAIKYFTLLTNKTTQRELNPLAMVTSGYYF